MAPSSYAQILAAGTAAAPFSYTVPHTVRLVPLSVTANFDGTGASGSWEPTLEIVSDGGVVIARVPVFSTLAAGATCEVTWAPFLRMSSSYSPSGGGGSGVGGPGTYVVPLPSGATQVTIDAIGAGGGGCLVTPGGAGGGGGGGGAYQHLVIPASAMAFPLTVVVPAGGSSGVPFTHPAGFDGAATTVTDANGVVWLTAAGGKGSPTGGSAGAGGTAINSGAVSGISGGNGGAGGIAGGNGTAAVARDGGGTSGGGGGGGGSNGGASGNGAKAGDLTLSSVVVVTGAAGGTAGATNGANAAQKVAAYGGGGGGGGAGNSLNPSLGGAGGLGYRGGGGGGGGSGGGTGGNPPVGGGNGGDGWCRVLFQ